MLSINDRKKLGVIQLKDLYYAAEITDQHSGYDVVYYFNCQEEHDKAKVHYTMLIDLSPDPEEILMSFKKKMRASIRKAIADENIIIRINGNPDQEEVKSFIVAYQKFAKWKHISKISTYQMKMLYELQSAGKLVISSAEFNGAVLSQFLLIDVGERLIDKYGYTVRIPEPKDKKEAQALSNLTRKLEFHSILYAKSIGKKYFDLCGVFLNPANESEKNVDQYKFGFNGMILKEYHFMMPITMRGRIFCWIRALKSDIS